MINSETFSLDGLGIPGDDNVRSFKEIIEHSEKLSLNMLGKGDALVTVGGEGLIRAIRNTLVGLINTFAHTVNTFKNLVFKFWKALKRTELEYWHESNLVSINLILRSDLSKYMETELDFPEKMSVPYLRSAETIDKFLNTIDMPNKMISINNHSESIVDSIFKNDDEVSTVAKDSFSMEFNLVQNARSFDSIGKCFSERSLKKTKPFRDLYRTTNEFRAVDKTLLKAVQHFYKVEGVYTRLQEIEERFQRVIEAVEKEEVTKLAKKDLNALSAYTTAIARLCDMYGGGLFDLQRVEHNFCVNLDYFKKAI